MISDEQRKYWTQKNPAVEWDTITFNHPKFDNPVRLVLNCFDEQVFQGEIYTPVAAELQKPEQSKDPVYDATVSFPRSYVIEEVEELLAKLDPFDQMTEIEMLLMSFSDEDRETPFQKWMLYVEEDGIRTGPDTIQITAGDDNPNIRSYYKLYTPDEDNYPGLIYM